MDAEDLWLAVMYTVLTLRDTLYYAMGIVYVTVMGVMVVLFIATLDLKFVGIFLVLMVFFWLLYFEHRSTKKLIDEVISKLRGENR